MKEKIKKAVKKQPSKRKSALQDEIDTMLKKIEKTIQHNKNPQSNK